MSDQGSEPDPSDPLRDVEIPVGKGFWRGLGRHGALIIGYALVVVHLGVLLTAAVLVDHADLSYAAERRLGQVVILSTVLVPIVAMCFLWIGELIRRGTWGGPSRYHSGSALPTGSTTVAVRMVSLGWAVAWVVGSAVPLGLLLWDIAARAENGYTHDLYEEWIVNGLIFAGALGATLAALVKKVVWLRSGAARLRVGAYTRQSRRSWKFWRSFSFRWRFDVWLCALGMIALFLCAVILVSRPAFSWDADGMTVAAALIGGPGVVVLATGLWATTQFWRTGEHLGSGESVA